MHIGLVSWQGSPEETRRLMKPGLPGLKLRNKSIEIRGVIQ